MNFIKYVATLGLTLALAACGGGGGNPGTPSGGPAPAASSPTGAKVTSVPTISVSIVDAADAAVVSNAVSSGAMVYAKAVVKDASLAVVPYKLVAFTTDSTIATLAQASALTDVNGVARVKIQPASLTAANAGSLVVTATVDTVAVSASLDYQTSAANVTLGNMLATPVAINALQTAAVAVEGRVNTVLAGSGVVSAIFSAPCGTFSPNPAPTGSDGIARTTYQSVANCAGPVILSSQATGSAAVTTTVMVSPALAANMVFSSATVPLMVSSTATGGVKQSTLKFQVLDSSGAGMSGQSVDMALGSTTSAAGVTFSVGGTATTAMQIVTTDGSGYASVTVSSGGLPTPVVVTATLASNATVQASSSGVAVTSGRATQNAASLSASKLSIDGYDYDGQQTILTMRVADRQGNPVPAGSIVNFVTGYGSVQGTCALDNASACSVTYTSQGIRPANGRVAILAYTDGEESFVDLNGDNIWQLGEPFNAVGTLYRDDNENGTYDSVTEQTYPGGTTGNSACASDVYSYPSVANTCDSTTWSGDIRVRQQIIIALASTKNDALVSLSRDRDSNGFTVHVTDSKGNSMPTGTTVTAAVMTSGAACTVTSVSPVIVRNSANGGDHVIKLDGAADCLAVRVDVTVTTPAPSSRATVVGF